MLSIRRTMHVLAVCALAIGVTAAVAGAESKTAGNPCLTGTNCCPFTETQADAEIQVNWADPNFYLDNKSELALSKDQVASLESSWLAHEKTRIRKEADLRILQMELAELLPSEETDLRTIEAKAKSVEAFCTELTLNRAKFERQAYSLLTEPQRTKLADLYEETRAADQEEFDPLAFDNIYP